MQEGMYNFLVQVRDSGSNDIDDCKECNGELFERARNQKLIALNMAVRTFDLTAEGGSFITNYEFSQDQLPNSFKQTDILEEANNRIEALRKDMAKAIAKSENKAKCAIVISIISAIAAIVSIFI